mgnify:CR=1 FL=1
MKRDMDIIRQIAFATELLDAGESLDTLEGISEEVFSAHVKWMKDAGLVDAHVLKVTSVVYGAMVLRLTWEGCDFIDAARSDTLWAKAKETVLRPSASWTFDILKEWLKSEIANGLPTLRRIAQ